MSHDEELDMRATSRWERNWSTFSYAGLPQIDHSRCPGNGGRDIFHIAGGPIAKYPEGPPKHPGLDKIPTALNPKPLKP